MEARLTRRKGLEVDLSKDEIRVDLTECPRTLTVRAVNVLTHLEKTYILKVTEKGLCLV